MRNVKSVAPERNFYSAKMKLFLIKDQATNVRNIVDRGTTAGRYYNVFALNVANIKSDEESGQTGLKFSCDILDGLRRWIPSQPFEEENNAAAKVGHGENAVTATIFRNMSMNLGFGGIAADPQRFQTGQSDLDHRSVDEGWDRPVPISHHFRGIIRARKHSFIPPTWKVYASMTIRRSAPEKIELKVEGAPLDKIREMCGNIELNVDVKNLQPFRTEEEDMDSAETEGGPQGYEIDGQRVVYIVADSTSDRSGTDAASVAPLSFRMEGLKLCRNEVSKCLYYFKEHDMGEIPALFLQHWRVGAYFVGEFTVEIVFPTWVNRDVTDKVKVNRKMLLEQIGTDVEIVAENGVSFKCHKSFLCAHSPVFEAMFRCDMEECRTGKIFMKDISSRGVQVLLMYLYCWELGDAAFDMDLALELLRTAHKYDMKDLDSDLTQMLLQRPIEMYSVNFALDLFLFARNIVLEYNLKLKAMKILKLYINSLESCPKYNELFSNDPDAAKELCKMAFMA